MDAAFLDWAFKALISAAIVYAVKEFKTFRAEAITEIKELRGSVSELNMNVALVIQKVAGHDKVLDKHDERIQTLEQGD